MTGQVKGQATENLSKPYINFLLTFVDMENQKGNDAIMKFMKFKQFSKRKNIEMMIDLDSLEQIKNGQNVIVKDNRTVLKEDGCFEVLPIAWSGSQVFIVCPFCGEIHQHGLAGGSYTETRTPHCKESDGMRCYRIRPVIA